MVMFERTVRIHRATARGDKGDDATDHVHLSINADGEAALVATNGKIAVVVPVEPDEKDRHGPIPKAAIVAAASSAPKGALAELRCGSRIGVPAADQTHGRPTVTGQFPDWKPVVPEAGRPREQCVMIDVEQLAVAAQAMGASCLRLRIAACKAGEKPKPIRLEAIGNCAHPEAYGVLMPLAEPDDHDEDLDQEEPES